MNHKLILALFALSSVVAFTACNNDPLSAENVNLEVSTDQVNFRSATQHKMVRVSSNEPWEVSIQYDKTSPTDAAQWVFTTNRKYTAQEHQLYITVFAYEPEQYNKREANITITSGKAQHVIHVTQTSDVVLKSSLHQYEASNKGTEFTIALKKNVPYVMTISAPWITQKTTRAFLSDTLSFAVATNTTEQERRGIITFFNAEHQATDTIFVHQNEKDVFRLVRDSRISENNVFAANQGADTMCVYIDQNKEYGISKYPSWISKTSKRPQTRAITTDSLYFAIKANLADTLRYDTLWFTPKDTAMKNNRFFIRIEQPGKPK